MKPTLYPFALMLAIQSMAIRPDGGSLGFGKAAFTWTAMSDPNSAVRQANIEKMRMKLRHEFGFAFLVYRDKIQTELGLAPDQKSVLDKYLGEIAPADMAFLQSNQAHSRDFDAYRAKALADLESVLNRTLSEVQRKRLDELVRQREGLVGGPSLWTGLEITDEEKGQFMAVIEPMQKKMEAAVAGAQQETDRAEIQRRVLGLRADLERRMEAVLTEAQRNQWKEMLGKPVPVEFLFDLTAG